MTRNEQKINMTESEATEYMQALVEGKRTVEQPMEAFALERLKKGFQRIQQLQSAVQQFQADLQRAQAEIQQLIGERGAYSSILVSAENDRRRLGKEIPPELIFPPGARAAGNPAAIADFIAEKNRKEAINAPDASAQ